MQNHVQPEGNILDNSDNILDNLDNMQTIEILLFRILYDINAGLIDGMLTSAPLPD